MSSALIHAHLTPIVARGPVCPVVALPTTFDAYLRSIGGNTRYTYQKKLRELRDRHGLTIDVIDAPSPDLDSGIEAFMRIHDLRWKSLGHPSVYDQQVHRDFLRRVAVSFAARGWLRLFVLRADGMVVSVSVEFNSRHRIYMYQSNAAGPDPLMRLSPGLVIKFAAIERGIAEGMTEYDTLRGEEPYKFDNLKAAPTYNRCLKVQNPDFRGRIGYSYSLVHLLLTKVRGRILLESYEYRRFVTTKRPSGGGRLRYATSRAASVFALGTRFIRTFVLRRHRKTAHTHSGEGVGH